MLYIGALSQFRRSLNFQSKIVHDIAVYLFTHVIADVSHHLQELIHCDLADGGHHLPSSTELHHDKRDVRGNH